MSVFGGGTLFLIILVSFIIGRERERERERELWFYIVTHYIHATLTLDFTILPPFFFTPTQTEIMVGTLTFWSGVLPLYACTYAYLHETYAYEYVHRIGMEL